MMLVKPAETELSLFEAAAGKAQTLGPTLPGLCSSSDNHRQLLKLLVTVSSSIKWRLSLYLFYRDFCEV